MAELQQILARRRSSADQHIYQEVNLPVGGRKSKQEQEGLAFRSGWSSTPGCAARHSFDISTPRGSFAKTTGDDDNRQGGVGHENVSDAESEDDIVKSGDSEVLNTTQRTLEVANAERDAANLAAANARDELAKAQDEIAQLRESLMRTSPSTDVLSGGPHDQQPESSKQALIVVQAQAAPPLITAALAVFDCLDSDQDGQLSPDDVQVFADLMTPPKDTQGPEALCQKIRQQLGMKESESMGRSQWLQLIHAKAADSCLGKQLTVVDLERLLSSLEALEAAGMR